MIALAMVVLDVVLSHPGSAIGLRSRPVVVAENPSDSSATTDSTRRSLRSRTVDQFVGKSLMIPLAMVRVTNSRRVRRRCHSPSGTTRLRHSSFTDRTNRSACALQFGAHGGVRTTRTPVVASHCPTALLHFGSRSQTKPTLSQQSVRSSVTYRRH